MKHQTFTQCDIMQMVNKTESIFHDYRIYLSHKLQNKNDKTTAEPRINLGMPFTRVTANLDQ